MSDYKSAVTTALKSVCPYHYTGVAGRGLWCATASLLHRGFHREWLMKAGSNTGEELGIFSSRLLTV